MTGLPLVVRWRRAIRDDRSLSWRARLVAFVIAEHLDASASPRCWPSHELLAAEAGTGRSTVVLAVAELREAGWISVAAGTGRHGRDGGREPNTYRPRVPVATRSQLAGGFRSPRGEVPVATRSGSGRHTTEKKPKKKPKKKPTSAATPRTRGPIFDALAEACGLDHAEMTERERDACGAAAAQLARLGSPPDRDEILRRGERWPQIFGEATCTPSAIARHWAQLGAERPASRDAREIAALARSMQGEPSLRVIPGGDAP